MPKFKEIAKLSHQTLDGKYKRPDRSGSQFVDNTKPDRIQPNDGVERPPWYHSTGSTDDHVREAVEESMGNRAPHTVQKGGGHRLFRCCYCRQFFDPQYLQIEHIVPFSAIARDHAFTQSEYSLVTNDVANLTYACGNTGGNGCNQSKRDRDPIEFLNTLTTTNLAQFFSDAPWASWMHAGNMLHYRPPWENSHVPPVISAGYNAAQADFLGRLKADSTPRPPLSGETCLVNRNNGIIASVRCVRYLRDESRIPPWLSHQVIKNVLSENEAGQFQQQYTPARYSITLAQTLQPLLPPAIEAALIQVVQWPRR